MDTYKIIRLGTNYCVVIAVTPCDAKPYDGTARYFRRCDWDIDDIPADHFSEISEGEVLGYFSGHADGCGREPIPERTFDTLDDINWFISLMQRSKIPAELRFTKPYLSENAQNAHALLTEAWRKLDQNPLGDLHSLVSFDYSGSLTWDDGIESVYMEPKSFEECLLSRYLLEMVERATENQYHIMLDNHARRPDSNPNDVDVVDMFALTRQLGQRAPEKALFYRMRLAEICMERFGMTLQSYQENVLPEHLFFPEGDNTKGPIKQVVQG